MSFSKQIYKIEVFKCYKNNILSLSLLKIQQLIHSSEYFKYKLIFYL